MDKFEMSVFISAMAELEPAIAEMDTDDQSAEALVYAMNNVRQYEGPRWFGKLGNGTFYADFDQSIWLEDTTPAEALMTLGEELTSDLDYF